jgi:3-methyladenine DNA glycosylase AlkD
MSIIERIRTELIENSDYQVKETGKKFFKEQVLSYGVRIGTVNSIAKNYYNQIKNETKQQILHWCEQLWKSGYLEETIIACHWSYRMRKIYEPGDFLIFEKWIENYVNNWASCDTFCNHTLGAFMELYPSYLGSLKNFALSENRWLRRAAAVSLIVPARRGKFLSDIFTISDLLLLDKDDLVQKGYGWLLKVASETHQNEVFEYVVKNKNVMPRTSLRYAIEKMPVEWKTIAMKK